MSGKASLCLRCKQLIPCACRYHVKVRVTLDVSEEVARRLAVLVGSTEETLEHRVADVLMELADHAQQGVYRPGSWERPWLVQAFGDYFLERVETDPNAPMFDRVKS